MEQTEARVTGPRYLDMTALEGGTEFTTKEKVAA